MGRCAYFVLWWGFRGTEEAFARARLPIGRDRYSVDRVS